MFKWQDHFFTIILENKIEANTSDGTRRTTFPLLIYILPWISIMLATKARRIHMLLAAAPVNKQSQSRAFPWSQQPTFRSCAKCLGFLRTPWRRVALLSLPDRMGSSPPPPHSATRPANNHLPYEAMLPLARPEISQSADQRWAFLFVSFEADLSIHFPRENSQPSISTRTSNKHPASSQTWDFLLESISKFHFHILQASLNGKTQRG